MINRFQTVQDLWFEKSSYSFFSFIQDLTFSILQKKKKKFLKGEEGKESALPF